MIPKADLGGRALEKLANVGFIGGDMGREVGAIIPLGVA
jgi:hypothetical protein